MEGEIQYFRKSFIGGFNRDDVVAYIAKLSNERNEAVKAAEKSNEELNKLRKKLDSLQKRFNVYEELIKEINNHAEAAKMREESDRSMPAPKPEQTTPPLTSPSPVGGAPTQERDEENVQQPQTKEKPVIVIKRKKS